MWQSLRAHGTSLLPHPDSARHCCVGRSRTAGDWSGDCAWRELGLRWFPVPGGRVISVAARWCLRHGLSCRDARELLAGRGITVDHVTGCRWVRRFTPELIEAARPGRHAPGARWFAGETYLKVAGNWTYSLPGCRPARPGHRRSAIGTE